MTEVVVKVTLLVGWSFVSFAWSGYVLSVLWGWFIVPAFGVPAIRVPVAIGIALLMGMLTHQTWRDGHEPETHSIVANSIVLPAVGLFAGWIVRMFL